MFLSRDRRAKAGHLVECMIAGLEALRRPKAKAGCPTQAFFWLEWWDVLIVEYNGDSYEWTPQEWERVHENLYPALKLPHSSQKKA